MNKTNFIKSFNRIIELGPIQIIQRIKNRTQKKLFIFKFKKQALLKIRNKYCFSWQKDFKTKKTSKTWGNKLLFYSDIKIEDQKTYNIFDYNPDIKIPWEKSRFQNLYILGQNYQKTKNETLAKKFKSQISNWINNNPFLFGVNWVCPMEVSIRAINWIYAFHLFKNSKTVSSAFWSIFSNSLYEHMIYLEGNWEESDKPNNHYLCDLIGYFYLTFFFYTFKNVNLAFTKASADLRKQKWVIKKLLKQFDKQIQSDGTSYEGSTSYHKLVTEVFWHFKLLCKNNRIKLPQDFNLKFNKMLKFINDCTDQAGNFIQIGDNDSGKILNYLITPQKKQLETYSHYPNFGLTIIKNKNWHITFRHPTFKKKQPTGHFHQDELSITLSIAGIPILIDPGSYIYTANSFARNYFRSYQSHNTFFVKKQNSFDDLFQLSRKEQNDTTEKKQTEKKIFINNKFNNLSRKLIFEPEKGYLELHDSCDKKYNIQWNFIFHPNINLEKHGNFWIIKKDKKILKMSSNINLEMADGFYSAKYGKFEKCSRLIGELKDCVNTIKTIFIKL